MKIAISNLEEDKENKFAPISKREQKFIEGIKELIPYILSFLGIYSVY